MESGKWKVESGWQCLLLTAESCGEIERQIIGKRLKIGMKKQINPWDAAKKRSVKREAFGYPLAELDPGVKYFVLMLEQVGAVPMYSCEGHPKEFYVAFQCSHETALRINQCGFFTVEIFQHNLWCIRLGDYSKEKSRTLRWAASSWERHLGKLK